MGKGGTSVVKTELPDEYKPFYKELFEEGSAAKDKVSTEAFSGQRIADYNQNLRSAQGGYASLGQQFAGVGNNLLQMGQDTLQGKYLNAESNPYLQSHIQAALQPLQQQFLEQTLPSMGSAAQRAGAFGGARQGIVEGIAHKNLLQTGQNISQQMAGQNYAMERQNQMNAGGLLTQGTQLNMLSPAMFQTAGGMQQQQQQNVLNANMQHFAEQQQAPFAGLNQYANLISGLNPGSTSTTTNAGQSTAGGALTGALGGAAMGAQFGGWGAIPGAIIGGLGGGLS